MNTSHFIKKILAGNQGISEFITPQVKFRMIRQSARLSYKTPGILEIVEDFQDGLTQSPGQKTF
jgi:hypothetical protein